MTLWRCALVALLTLACASVGSAQYTEYGYLIPSYATSCTAYYAGYDYFTCVDGSKACFSPSTASCCGGCPGSAQGSTCYGCSSGSCPSYSYSYTYSCNGAVPTAITAFNAISAFSAKTLHLPTALYLSTTHPWNVFVPRCLYHLVIIYIVVPIVGAFSVHFSASQPPEAAFRH